MKTPFRLFSTLVLVTLFAWLMPLGAFIGASQEKTACGGKRAFHMCSMMGGKAPAEGSVKVSYSNPGSAGKTAKSSASGGDDFTVSRASGSSVRKSRSHLSPETFVHLTPSREVPIPPPKNGLLF